MARWSITPPLPGESADAALQRMATEYNLILAEQEQESLKLQAQGGYTAQFSGPVDMQGNKLRGLPNRPVEDSEACSLRFHKSGNFLYSEGNTFTTEKYVEHAPATTPGGSVTLAQVQEMIQAAAGNVIPSGIIVIWSGAIVDIPAGWALCDGTGGTENLVNYFIPAAGGTYAVNATGGADTLNLAHGHGAGTLVTGGPDSLTNVTGGATAVASSTHLHAISGGTDVQLSSTTENRPRYWAKAYIQKL